MRSFSTQNLKKILLASYAEVSTLEPWVLSWLGYTTPAQGPAFDGAIVGGFITGPLVATLMFALAWKATRKPAPPRRTASGKIKHWTEDHTTVLR